MREGVNVVTSGAIEPRGEGYEVSVRAIDAGDRQDDRWRRRRRPRARRTCCGPRTAWPRGPQRARRRDAGVGAARRGETYTAGSLEAAHEYALAQDLQWEGKWDEADQHYRKALELDPNLGRAYAGLAAVESNRGRRQEAEK